MEHIHHIRYEFNVTGKSIRQIARETGHDRQTVKKIVEQEDFSKPDPIKRIRSKKTDQYRDQVHRWLIEDQSAPRKQHHTARRVFHRLKEMEELQSREITVSERSICNLVAELKEELGQTTVASLPLLHPAGEAQVDFGETAFYERGAYYEGYHLALTLPHSDAKYVQLFKGQNFECLAHGLIDIFHHIGGVPSVIRFDNMSTAVKAIKAHGEREVTDNFRRLQCHFGFESNFCNPNSGNEKGSVENYVGYSRRNYFVPVPEMTDLVVYNRELLQECDKGLQREHYKLERLVSDLFEEDKVKFKPLPRYPFEVSKHVLCRTNAYGMAKFATNSYSTGGNLARREVTLKVGAHTVTVLDQALCEVVTHPRLYGKNKESMYWGPYLDVLALRPTALKYSGFYEGLPGEVKHFLSECDLPGKRQIIGAVSRATKAEGIDKSVCALQDALSFSPKDADSFVAAYGFALQGPLQVPKNAVPADLPPLSEYELNLKAYGKLMGDERCRR